MADSPFRERFFGVRKEPGWFLSDSGIFVQNSRTLALSWRLRLTARLRRAVRADRYHRSVSNSISIELRPRRELWSVGLRPNICFRRELRTVATYRLADEGSRGTV